MKIENPATFVSVSLTHCKNLVALDGSEMRKYERIGRGCLKLRQPVRVGGPVGERFNAACSVKESLQVPLHHIFVKVDLWKNNMC